MKFTDIKKKKSQEMNFKSAKPLRQVYTLTRQMLWEHTSTPLLNLGCNEFCISELHRKHFCSPTLASSVTKLLATCYTNTLCLYYALFLFLYIIPAPCTSITIGTVHLNRFVVKLGLQLLGISHFSNSLHEVFLNYKVMVSTDGKHTCKK